MVFGLQLFETVKYCVNIFKVTFMFLSINVVHVLSKSTLFLHKQTFRRMSVYQDYKLRKTHNILVNKTKWEHDNVCDIKKQSHSSFIYSYV